MNPLTRGGDRRSLLSQEMKNQLLQYVDNNCTLTLQEMATWIFDEFQVNVSKSTIDRALREFHYTLKMTTLIAESRNYDTAIENRLAYA